MGDAMTLGPYRLVCQTYTQDSNRNFDTEYALLDVFRGGKKITQLAPERRFYQASQTSSTMVALHSTLASDLYVIYEGRNPDTDKPIIKVFLNPLMNWIWIGVLIVVMGTFLALVPNLTRTPARVAVGEPCWRRLGVSMLSCGSAMAAVVVCLLAVVMLGADPSSRFNKIGHEMICTCGCGQVLLECNHVGCPVSPVMINELHAQMDGGGSDTLILNWFAAKYGATVLAAPIRGGFDNVAWIAPMAAFLLATVGVGFLIRMWTMRSGRHAPVSAAGHEVGGDALRERIRRETEY